jgi:hypothetical protein
MLKVKINEELTQKRPLVGHNQDTLFQKFTGFSELRGFIQYIYLDCSAILYKVLNIERWGSNLQRLIIEQIRDSGAINVLII